MTLLMIVARAGLVVLTWAVLLALTPLIAWVFITERAGPTDQNLGGGR